MKAAELRDLGSDELGAKEREMTDQLFRMRIQKSMGQLEAPDTRAHGPARSGSRSRPSCDRRGQARPAEPARRAGAA